jgi:hypothetical protein
VQTPNSVGHLESNTHVLPYQGLEKTPVPIDNEDIEALEVLIENDDWEGLSSAAERYGALSQSADDNSSQQQDSSVFSSSDQESETVSTAVNDEDIEVLERLVENDDWEGLSSSAKRHSDLSSSSFAESSQSECANISYHLGDASDAPDRMEAIDRLIEEGNWEELAHYASELARRENESQSEDSSGRSQVLEIGQVDLIFSSGSSDSRSNNEGGKSTKLSFLESMAETSRSELDRSGSEGAGIAAEWAISRSLSVLVDHEKIESDLLEDVEPEGDAEV